MQRRLDCSCPLTCEIFETFDKFLFKKEDRIMEILPGNRRQLQVDKNLSLSKNNEQNYIIVGMR